MIWRSDFYMKRSFFLVIFYQIIGFANVSWANENMRVVFICWNTRVVFIVFVIIIFWLLGWKTNLILDFRVFTFFHFYCSSFRKHFYVSSRYFHLVLCYKHYRIDFFNLYILPQEQNYRTTVKNNRTTKQKIRTEQQKKNNRTEQQKRKTEQKQNSRTEQQNGTIEHQNRIEQNSYYQI